MRKINHKGKKKVNLLWDGIRRSKEKLVFWILAYKDEVTEVSLGLPALSLRTCIGGEKAR